jgi:hypothetical protein
MEAYEHGLRSSSVPSRPHGLALGGERPLLRQQVVEGDPGLSI